MLRTHGLSGTPEYRAWVDMRRRCYNVQYKHYDIYGGRGITVCEHWTNSFENFYEDIGLRPSTKHSLDRIDVNGNYCLENCRWATKLEQDRNKRKTRFVDYKGKQTPICELAEKFNIDRTTLFDRLERGWNIEKALTTPVLENKNTKVYLEFDGERLSLSEWSRKLGIGHSILSRRRSKGWSVEQILTTPIKKRSKNKKNT